MGADKFDAITRQIIFTSEGKHEAAKKDFDDDCNYLNTNKFDKGGKTVGSQVNQASGDTSSQQTPYRKRKFKDAAIFFMMNLVRFSKVFLFSFFKMVPESIFSVPNIFVQQRKGNIAFII